MQYNLSVIIPVYKEEHRITRCIEESLFFFRNNPLINHFEILFIADVSGDKTIEIIQKHLYNKEIQLIVNKTREQKGGAVKIGALQAKYPYIIYYDADLSTPLYEINSSLALLDQYDIVIGSRGLKESQVQKRPFKIFMSKCFSLLKFLFLGIRFQDTQCGFKLFKKKTLVIFEKQTIKSSCFDVELLYIAQKYGFSIKEKAVTWMDSDLSNFQTWRIVPSFIKDMAKIRLQSWKGLYKKF